MSLQTLHSAFERLLAEACVFLPFTVLAITSGEVLVVLGNDGM